MNRKHHIFIVILYYFVLIALVYATLLSFVHVFTIPNPDSVHYKKVLSDRTIDFVQCVLGLGIFYIPSLLEKRFRVLIPNTMYLMFLLFIFASIFLGQFLDFYYYIPYWDIILHTFSGLFLGTVGFSLVNLLNKMHKISMNPVFVCIFAFCFAVSLGVIWEIYEFTVDGLLGMNMQKFALGNGTPLIGRAALCDTMEDLIVDCLGALFTAIIGYISLHFQQKWFQRFTFHKNNKGV